MYDRKKCCFFFLILDTFVTTKQLRGDRETKLNIHKLHNNHGVYEYSCSHDAKQINNFVPRYSGSISFFFTFLLCHSAVGSLITLVSVLTNQVTTAVAF